jgi:hypothetical protein
MKISRQNAPPTSTLSAFRVELSELPLPPPVAYREAAGAQQRPDSEGSGFGYGIIVAKGDRSMALTGEPGSLTKKNTVFPELILWREKFRAITPLLGE